MVPKSRRRRERTVSIYRRRFLIAALPAALLGAVRGDDVMYVGGSLSSVPEKTKGVLDVSGENEARFNSKKATFGFQFKKVTSLEYGQKAGRRVGVALVVNPLFLFSKKRKHYLTIGFNDDAGKPQGVVLEVGKGNVRPLLTALEAKSGKEVEYESEDARKHAGN